MSADFGEVLATLLVGLAHARRVADEQAASMAEYYKQNPLLEGVSIPRIRVPELSIDLPLLIEEYSAATPATATQPAHVIAELKAELAASAKRHSVKLLDSIVTRFDTELSDELRMIGNSRKLVAEQGGYSPREITARGAETAFLRAIEAAKPDSKPGSDGVRKILSDLRSRATEVALDQPGKPARVKTSVVTSEVKEKANPENVVRVRLVMKEEGLEWSVAQNADGSTRRTLTPE